MKGTGNPCSMVGVLVIGLTLGACRQAEDEGSGGAGANKGASSVARPGTAGPGHDEVPSKLARERGRTPDGRKPAAPRYQEGVTIPGKPGYVFNPFTNNPVDVRGIPEGTLVRDPADPNKDHKFRVPKPASQSPKNGRDGENQGLKEVPMPRIP